MNRALEAQSKQMTSALVSPGKKQRPGYTMQIHVTKQHHMLLVPP